MCEKGEGGGEHRWFPTVQTSLKKYLCLLWILNVYAICSPILGSSIVSLYLSIYYSLTLFTNSI